MPEPFSLSYNQSSLWYLQQYAPSTSAYNVHFTARIRSPLDSDALQRAFDTMVARHPMLRTTFASSESGPVQVAGQDTRVDVVEVDVAPEVDDDALRAMVATASSQPYDLAAGPNVRLHVWHRASDDHVLLLAAHHTIFDLAGVTVLLDELFATYAGLVGGAPAELAPIDVSYRDFVQWQQDLLAGEQGSRQGSWWAEHLGPAPAVLHLSTDRPRPPLQSLRGDTVPFVIGPELTAGIAALAKEEGASTFRVVLAAFHVLLHRYSEQDEILVGSPAAGRTDPRFRPIVSHCVNMLAVRAEVSGNPTFRSVVAQVNDAVLGAMDNQDYPFPLIVERLQPARDASRSPLFQVAFSYQRAEIEALPGFLIAVRDREGFDHAGLRFEPFPIPQQNGAFDLSVWMARSGDELIGELKYAVDLFDRSTVERAVEHFRNLLAAGVADPDRSVGALPMLTPGEERQILADWNSTEHGYDEHLCMHELFEAQVDRDPAAVAAVFGGRTQTYGELEGDANRLAHLLRELAAEPGDLVGVYLDRSLEIPTALLGILKSGAGYVPLDTTHPQARIELILSSLPVTTIVSQARHVPALQALDVPNLAHVIVLDDPAPDPENIALAGPRATWTRADLASRSAMRPELVSRPTDTAYIIFTSGSTGTPKGVEVMHRPAINLIQWVNETFAVGPSDRLLMVTSLCFDLSVYDVFGVLGAGGSLHLASVDDMRDPTRLVQSLVDEPITCWDSAPPALQQLVPFLPERAPASPLRLVLLSGDWIPLPLPDAIRSVFPRAEVVSLGGATEATIWSNVYRIGRVEPHWVSIPYGRPIWNARYYVLDPHGNPCPVGVPGDLFIGGQCLASGYVNDPSMTSGKFVPDPFDERPGARMYRTGDRARFFVDGNIEFLGRKDFQVKIRGYRIELGEIEAVLRQHDGVGECIVLARDDGGERALVAYVVPAGGEAPAGSEVRAFLRDRLPQYMVPAHVVLLDRMPITPNGKLDRRALPAPEGVRDLAAEYVEPRTELERAIAAIWTTVLGVDRVGVDDDFFELGGHSLQSVEIVLQLEELVGRSLALSILLQAPTVAALAIAVGAPEATDSIVVPLRGGGTRPPLVLVHPAGGDLLPYRALVGCIDPAWPVLGIRSRAIAGADEHETIDAMADAYAAALLAEGVSECAVVGWSMGGVLAHAVAARLEAEGCDVAMVGLIDAVLLRSVADPFANQSYRLGAAFGPLAPVVATVDPDELVAATDRLLALPDDERLGAALAWAHEHGLTPPPTGSDGLRRQGELIRQHEAMLRAHEAPVVRAPLHVSWATDTLTGGMPPTDWAVHTTAATGVCVHPGNHYSLLQAPTVDSVAAELVAALHTYV